MKYDELKDELLSSADSAMKYARSLNADAEVEIYLYYEQSGDASLNQGIVDAKDGAVAGNAVRVSIGKKVGFASASGVTTERVERSINEALSLVRSVEFEDDRFQGFADPKAPGKDGIFNENILELGVDDMIRSCQALSKEARATDDRIKMVSTTAETHWGAFAIANTRGILEASCFGYNGIQVMAIAMENGERKSSFDFDYSREHIYSGVGLGENAAKKALKLLGGEKIDITEKLPTIWEPVAASTYLLSSLGQAAVGEPVVDGVSPLCDMIGDSIASDTLSVIDDGQSPNGLSTTAVDAEGHPQSTTPIIEDGVLKNFLFDTYFARAFGVESTGNCARGGGFFGGPTPYEDTPRASTTNLIVQSGKKSQQQVLESIDGKALFIEGMPLGIFHTSVATGEFSIVANNVYLVENGSIAKPVKPVSISGNFYDGFKNLISVGRDSVKTPFDVETPTLAFDGFSITG
jgi:PmbA protein